MSALVFCGKRSFFEDLTTSPPSSSSSSSSSSKRLRFSATSSPAWFTLIDQLIGLFPYMDIQLLEKALDECDNDINAAIKKLHGLSLGYGAVNTGLTVTEESNGNMEKGGGTVAEPDFSANNLLQQSIEMGGAEWVELFVQEMMSATSVDDARSRATKVLESLEKSISTRARAEASQSYHKENEIIKEQIEQLLHENSILKRAVGIQHERQKEYDNKDQEVQHLKQLVSQYQEQIRTLEVNNYALTMHLQQAQQNSSLPGRFNPDIF